MVYSVFVSRSQTLRSQLTSRLGPLVLQYLFVSTNGLPDVTNTHTTDLAQRQLWEDCSVAKCGQACFGPFQYSQCQIASSGHGDFPWLYYTLRDTSGAITRFNDSQKGAMPPIGSLIYAIPSANETASCPYIQYTFYDAENLTVGSTYITPGQDVYPCISFASAVTAYSGITMLAPVPEELLEWAGYGNIMDEGSQPPTTILPRLADGHQPIV